MDIAQAVNHQHTKDSGWQESSKILHKGRRFRFSLKMANGRKKAYTYGLCHHRLERYGSGTKVAGKIGDCAYDSVDVSAHYRTRWRTDENGVPVLDFFIFLYIISSKTNNSKKKNCVMHKRS